MKRIKSLTDARIKSYEVAVQAISLPKELVDGSFNDVMDVLQCVISTVLMLVYQDGRTAAGVLEDQMVPRVIELMAQSEKDTREMEDRQKK